MEPAKIVLRALAIFCGYGALFGIVCSQVSPEAYTLARPPAFGSLPVPLLGMLWGMFDFLIFSAAVGIGTALAAHVGPRPTVKAFFFTKPMIFLAAVVALCGAVGGLIGHRSVAEGSLQIESRMASLPQERHPAYLSTWWAMLASQGVMIVGGATLAVWTYRKRAVFEKMAREAGYLRD